jgi:glucokinase
VVEGVSAQAKRLPVYIENDVNAGTFGEYVFGAARGVRNVVGIFPGTGIGGGIIIDGKLHHGFRDSAAEIGHMVIMVDGPLCGCGKRGCAEALASRTAITRDIKAALYMGRKSMITDLAGKDPRRITSGSLVEAWKAGDELVCEVLTAAQRYLGILTGSVVNLLDPEMIVFGGGMVEALGDEFLEPVRLIARNYYILRRDVESIQLVTSQLGDFAVVLGAAAIALERAEGKSLTPGD